MSKRWLSILAVAVAILAGILHFLPGQALSTGSWGLSFKKEGYAPKGPATAQELAQFNAAFLGDTTNKRIYLTFDSGYENGCTEKILDILKKHHVPAAFFLVGNYIERNPELVKRMISEGHIVGNHTMHHYDMSRIKEKENFEKELTDLESLYKEVTGQEMEKYYRPPQGIYSQENLEMASALGYKTLFWSLAYVDWNNHSQPSREQAMSKLLPRIHNGAVILLHSTSQTNTEVLDEVLTEWKKMGYSFGDISEIFPG